MFRLILGAEGARSPPLDDDEAGARRRGAAAVVRGGGIKDEPDDLEGPEKSGEPKDRGTLNDGPEDVGGGIRLLEGLFLVTPAPETLNPTDGDRVDAGVAQELAAATWGPPASGNEGGTSMSGCE